MPRILKRHTPLQVGKRTLPYGPVCLAAYCRILPRQRPRRERPSGAFGRRPAHPSAPPPWRRSPDACVSRMGKPEATTMVARNRRLPRHPDDRIDLHAGCGRLLLTELRKGEYDQFSKEGAG
jgi:hypothetical protein